MTTQLAGLNLSDTDIQLLLVNCLKPEEISGDSGPQLDRIKELMYWFSRYARGKANGKWLSGHAFELCYYIATMSHNKPTIPPQPAGPVWVKAINRQPDKSRKYIIRLKVGGIEEVDFKVNQSHFGEAVDVWLDENNTQQVFTREQVEHAYLAGYGAGCYQLTDRFEEYMSTNYPC